MPNNITNADSPKNHGHPERNLSDSYLLNYILQNNSHKHTETDDFSHGWAILQSTGSAIMNETTDITEQQQCQCKNKNGSSFSTLLKNSFSTSFKIGSMLDRRSNRKNIIPPNPKKPTANPKPEANKGVYSLCGAVL